MILVLATAIVSQFTYMTPVRITNSFYAGCTGKVDQKLEDNRYLVTYVRCVNEYPGNLNVSGDELQVIK